ncbi:arabinan endo-1,5-alpha-L-arabinosidase [Neobacillus notoginsengisoli]|uniref:Endo-alpha-(1->5)-L-arabinanase n=1 Tax=Neobacillus notoginsengisoli TaxID=1578198 RepID=A0A417YZD7_9BACI|nr:arabinan endo-1,5-alpha-L-arabinosidase [Neobacillus notoginsengisoli]
MSKKWIRSLLILAAVFVGLAGCNEKNEKPAAKNLSPKSGEFQNPVFEPVMADPSIIEADDGYFYVYGTEDNWGDGMGPRYVPVVRSKDLVKWDYVGEAFEAGLSPNWKEGGIWAPDIRYYQNKYYLYYSLSTWGDEDPGIGVATSDVPEGPFTDHGKLLRSLEIGVDNSIDPAFYDDNGTPYLFWGSFHGIYGIELTKDGLKTVGNPFQVAGNAFEAPYIMKKNGYYYMFLSLGSCCEGENSTYHVAVARSKSIKGPYLDKDGKDIMTSNGTVILASSKNFAGPGHNAIITDKEGKDWIVYHAIQKDEPKMISGITRRPLMLDPIIWKDGWPSIKKQEPGEKPQKAPKL